MTERMGEREGKERRTKGVKGGGKKKRWRKDGLVREKRALNIAFAFTITSPWKMETKDHYHDGFYSR